MKSRTDKYLNSLFKTPYYLGLSQIFRITVITVIASGGQIVKIELYRRILQALFSADSYALLRELELLAVYEILYCGIVRLNESQYAKIEGNILGQLLDKVLTKNGKLRSLSNCPMGANDRFSMASEDCCQYASGMVSKAALFADFVIVPCYIIYGCSINIAITAAITAISIFLSILNRKNKRKLYDCNQEYNESFAHWTNFLWKAVDNLEVIKVFLNKKKIRDEQMKRNEALDAIQQRRLKTYLDMTLIEESSDMVFTLFILCAAFFAAARKMILVTDILAMVESLNVVQKAIFALPEKLIQLHELESMADRISRFEKLEEDIAIVNDIKAFEKLTLKQVTFAFEEKTVLKDIDFAFEKGKFYIVAGASGCGKSTLLKVLSKLLPYRGNICWNQSELGEISRQALYKRLSYQGQNQVFLEDTIRENIGFQAGDDKERYEQILESFFVGKIFSENQIDDTQLLSFRGAPLSSGESQMVTMAGVLYEPREVILLDEVFSALDPAKEQVFFRELASLAKEGKLIILVSHRLTNLEAADEILFMEEGRICEKGSLYDLMRSEGKFYEWYQGNRERSGK